MTLVSEVIDLAKEVQYKLSSVINSRQKYISIIQEIIDTLTRVELNIQNERTLQKYLNDFITILAPLHEEAKKYQAESFLLHPFHRNNFNKKVKSSCSELKKIEENLKNLYEFNVINASNFPKQLLNDSKCPDQLKQPSNNPITPNLSHEFSSDLKYSSPSTLSSDDSKLSFSSKQSQSDSKINSNLLEQSSKHSIEFSKIEEKQDPPEISRDTFTSGVLIKRSEICEIYHGKWNGNNVMLKKVIVNPENKEEDQHHFMQYKIKSQYNFVEMYGYSKDEGLWLLFEFTPYGTLFDLIHTHGIFIPLCLQLKMLIDVANAMKFLHGQKPELLHRDLQSQNLMVFPGCTIKVTNLVPMKILSSFVTHSYHQIGSEIWTAPEILIPDKNDSDNSDDSDDENNEDSTDKKKYSYSKQSDVWSFSIVTYEVITKRLPFNGDVGELVTKLRRQSRPCISSGIRNNPNYAQLIELMKKCWAQNFDMRPLFPEIYDELSELFLAHSEDELNQESTKIIKVLHETNEGNEQS